MEAGDYLSLATGAMIEGRIVDKATQTNVKYIHSREFVSHNSEIISQGFRVLPPIYDRTRFSCSTLSFNGRITVNLQPLPASLFNSILPFIMDVSFVTMERPNPNPLCLAFSMLFTCSKASKTRFCASGGMPIPVSITWIAQCFAPRFIKRTVTEPFSVN